MDPDDSKWFGRQMTYEQLETEVMELMTMAQASKRSIYTSAQKYDPWEDDDAGGAAVELRRIASTNDTLYGRTCSECGKKVKTNVYVLSLLTMDGGFNRAVIHVACLEPHLDGMPDSTKIGAARQDKAREGLLKMEKDLAARAG